VRQLEFMVRLAEALDRFHLVKNFNINRKITVQHVTDACKLLRTSIGTIDQDRVDLGEDVEEVPAAAAEGDMDMNQGEDDDVMQDVTTYARMTRQIIINQRFKGIPTIRTA
jgi:DNA replicative helicase MCM subunit Mcm2 (Cdc46/Mcm family)